MVPDTDDDEDDETEPTDGGGGRADPVGEDAPGGTADDAKDDATDDDRENDPIGAGGNGRGGDGDVDSNWWYLVAAVPLYWVASSVAGFAFALVALAFALTGAGFGYVGGIPELGAGLGALGFVAVALLLVAVGMALSVAFPVAVYLDAEAINDHHPDGDWEPDPALYGLLGLAGVVVQPLQVPLAVYYLYKRRESVGRP
jgi:hypothetical protein